MGLREKVTITLVIIALTQIACRHCMPRTPRKASLKLYLNDLKPVKNNPVSTPYSPSKVNKTPKKTLGKTAQSSRINQNSLPQKSLYNTYNFPENEYPLDNAPRDPFRIGMNFNENNHVNTLQQARNLQSSAINDLKKEMKMKRKLLSNKQVNNENIPLKTDMSSIKIASNPDLVRLLDPETFPDVQYPLNTMETWGQNYWNYLAFTQEKQLNGLGQQAFNPKAKEDINQPFTRLTKEKASKFLQSYDKLKEDHRRTSTENSKRSNVGQKGLNFTKTATCEKVSDDFIAAGLLSNTLANPSETKTLDSSSRHNANSAENTCPLIENPYHPMPLPYKVIEENIENVCPAFELKNNTQELEDDDSSVIAKTLQLIEEILLNDDTSPKVPTKHKSKEKENNVTKTETHYAGGSANKDIPINSINDAETSTVVPIEELSQEVFDDAQADTLPYNLPSLSEETIPENKTIVAGPLNVRMPLPFTEPLTYGALTNTSSPDLTNMTTLSNVITVPGYTSIIIIPMNNDAVGKSHKFDTTSNTPIIVYLPSTQSSSIPSQTPPLNHVVSSSLGNPVPNNQLYNVLSNMAPVQNDKPSSTALVSELLNSISDSGSSLPIHKTLPTNSKCYNNENSPSSTREKPVSGILIPKSLIDDTPFVNPSCDENLFQQPVQTDNFFVNPDTLTQTSDFEHPVFDFADSNITSSSHGPYNKVLINELPIIVHEIDSDQQINDISSKDLFTAIQDITSEKLHKTTSTDSVSDDSLSESPNDVPTVILNKDFSSETVTDSLEILKNMHISESLPNLPVSVNKSISTSPIFKQISESLQTIADMSPTSLIETPTVELPVPTEASLAPISLSETLSDNLPERMDPIVSDTTSNNAPKSIDNPVPSPIFNSTPMTTDLTVKTELYKIRQILDRMLSSETLTVNQPPSMGTTLSPILETDSLPLLTNQLLSPIQKPIDSQTPPSDEVLSLIVTPTDSQPPSLDKVLSPISDTDSLLLVEEQSLSPIPMASDSQPPPLDKVLSPIQTATDSQPPPLDKVLSPIQTATDSQLPLDKVLSPISDTDSLPLVEEQSLSPIQTPTDSQPPLNKVLSPISYTESLPLVEEQSLLPIPMASDSQPPPLEKVLLPIQTATDSQPSLHKVLSPISDTDSLPLVEEQSLSPISMASDNQPPPLDKVLSPIQTATDSQPPPLDKVLSPIQTATDSQLPLDKVLSPISDTDSLPLVEEQSLSPIQTPTDSQPPPLDKVLSPISYTESVPLVEEQSLSPIPMASDSQPPPLDKVLSPIQTPTDSQPPLDKVLSPFSDTDSLSLLEEQSLSPLQTPTDSQPPPLEKVWSPIQTATDSQPSLDKALSPISDTDSLPLVEEHSLSPILTPINHQPPPLDKVLAPIQMTIDSQPPPLDKVLSPIQTAIDSQPPLDKVLSPISGTDSLPLVEEQSLSPIQTPTDSQPPPLEKVLSPISDTDSLPLVEEQSLSPIQTPTDSQPPPLDKVLSPIQIATDSQLPLDKVLSPISDTDSLPLVEEQSLSPIQTPTDSQPPLNKVLSPISYTESLPLVEEQSLSPIPMASDSQPPPLEKILSPIQTPTDSQPPLDKVLAPIQTATDSQPPSLDKVFSPIQTPTDSQPPLDKVLSLITDTDSLSLQEEQSLSPLKTPTDSQPPLLDQVLSPIQTATDSQPPLDKVLSPISDTDSLPLVEEQSLSPLQTPTDSQTPPLDKVFAPVLTPIDHQPPPLDKVLTPIQMTIDSQPPPLDKVLSPIQTAIASQPPLDKVLSPISGTDSLPLVEEQSLSPIQTPTDSPPPLDKVLAPIQKATDSQPPPLDKVFAPILTPIDHQPPPLDKVLTPIQTPTDSQPPLDKVLAPIQKATDSQPPPLDKVFSPIQTLTDSQPPLDKVLSLITDTDSLSLQEEQSLSPLQTLADSQPPPLDKVLSPIQAATDSQPPLDKVLSPISDTDSLPLAEEQSLSPIQTPTYSQPPPLDKVLSPISYTESVPLVEEQSLSPIPMASDSQPPPLDKVLSPIQTPTDSQPPLDKVLSPISDTDSLPLVEEQSLSPLQTPTDSQTPPLDKVFAPILTPIDHQPPPLDKVLTPIQMTIDSQPPPLDKVLSPIQTPTDSQPPLDKVLSPISGTDSLPFLEEQSLSPIQTPTDSQPPPLDKVLSPISDTGSWPLPENRSLSSTQTPTDSGPLLAGGKTRLPLPKTDSPIDSLQLQHHETFLKSPSEDGSKDTLPSAMDKSNLSNSVLESTDRLFETVDNKPYLIHNLVTPLYEHVTSRTKDITNNDFPHKTDDLPLKMDLEFPDIYEVHNDDLSLYVDDLPIKVLKENSESSLLMVDLPMNVVETPNLLSKTLVSDLIKPTEVLSLPVERVLEIASTGFPSHSDMSLMSDSMDNDHQDFTPSKYASDGLPALPMDEFKSPIHEVIPNSQSHEISSEIQPQKYDLPLTVDELIPDISFSDALSNESFVIDDSPSLVTDKIPETPNSTADTKDLLIDNRLLSLQDDASPDTLVTDIPTTVLPSLNEPLQSTYLDKSSDEVFLDLHRDDLPLPDDKTLPLPDNTMTNLLPSNKILSTLKLPIAKALLESVLSDITKGVLSSQVTKALSITPPSDKTVYYVFEKSPLFETKEIPLLPVENSFPNAEHNDNLIVNLHVTQIAKDAPTTDLPLEFPLPMVKMYNDKPENSTDDAKSENENGTQTSEHLSDDQPLPKDKISPLTDTLSDISRNQKSSSKLPITKVLLEKLLSEINTKGFSTPVSKAVPATSSSVLDKIHYYIVSDYAEDSPPLPKDKILPETAHTGNNLPFSGQSEDTLSLEKDKTLSEIQSIDVPTEISSPMDKIVPSLETEILPFPIDTQTDSQLSNDKNKTPSSSKLPIAKALLENVLSDINTKGFLLPEDEALPVASRTQLDKTLYFLESPRRDTTKESSVSEVPTENDLYSERNEDGLPLSADKVVPDNPIIDISTDELMYGIMNEDNSEDLTEEEEDSDETLFSEELTDDFLSVMEKPHSLVDMPDDLSVPPTKQLLSSRLPITKALLEKVLSDITDGAIAAKDLNHPNL